MDHKASWQLVSIRSIAQVPVTAASTDDMKRRLLHFTTHSTALLCIKQSYTIKLNLVVCIIVTLILTVAGVSFARDKDEKPTNVKSKAAGKGVKNAAKGAAIGGVVGKVTDEPGKGVAAGAAAVGAKKRLGKDDKDSKRKDGFLDEKLEKGLKKRKQS